MIDVMSSPLALSPSARRLEIAETTAFDATPARGPSSTKASFSSFAAPSADTPFRLRELGVVLALSAFFHAGVAAAAFRPSHDTHGVKRVSRVEVELARAPEPLKPATKPFVPPPPPALPKQAVKPLAAAPPNVVSAPAPSDPVAPANDSGSSAPAEDGGELHAGNAGLGIAPPAPSPPSPPPVPIAAPVIQAREGANYLKNPRPAYPRRAKREGLEGTTVLRVQVQPSGKPGGIKVQKSSGHELLDEAALETVAQWTFAPATRGGEPVAGSVLVPIVFRLQ
jgi:protein TonB